MQPGLEPAASGLQNHQNHSINKATAAPLQIINKTLWSILKWVESQRMEAKNQDE